MKRVVSFASTFTMLNTVAAWAALALGTLASAQQVVLNGGRTAANPALLAGAGNVATRSLSSIVSQNDFLALSHPRFPAHQVRIKKSEFCDPTVK